DRAEPAAQARVPSGSVVVPEEEVHERVVEPPAAGEDDRRMLAEAEAPPDVEPEHQRGAERGPQAEPVASPRALGLLALQPARADVGEEGALDPREPDLAEREGHGEAMQDREPPFLVQEPEARAGEGIARVSAQLVRAAEYGARRDRAVAEEPVEADGIRAVERGAEVPPEIADQHVVLRGGAARHVLAGHITRRSTREARHEPDRHVVTGSIDRTGVEPQRVVLDEGEVVAREHAVPREVARVRAGVAAEESAVEEVLHVDPAAPLDPETELQAVELAERIAADEVAAVGLLVV